MEVTFKGIALSSLGVIVEQMVTIKKPKRRKNRFEVDGRNGSISYNLGYGSYDLEAIMTLTDPTKFDQVFALLDGYGPLICSDDPLKFRTAEVIEEVEWESIAIWKKGKVTFFIEDPFRYLITEAPVTLTSSGSVTNAGTLESMPLLKLTGSGTVVLTIGSQSFTYSFDTPYVYIDRNIKQAYYGSTRKTRNMIGNYPVLNVGANAISWTGNITQLVVTKRTRWL